jgi:hypothetical protein
MNVTVDKLVQQAKQLSPEEQAILSERILELVSPPDPEWEAAWIRECEDRIAACERGEMETIDSDVAMEWLRKKHGLK